MKKLLYILISTLAFSDFAQAALKHPTCTLYTTGTLDINVRAPSEMQIVGKPEYERIFENLGYTVEAIPKKYEDKDIVANLYVNCAAEKDYDTRQIMYYCAAVGTFWQKDSAVKTDDGFKQVGFGRTAPYGSLSFTEATRIAIYAASAFAPRCIITK